MKFCYLKCGRDVQVLVHREWHEKVEVVNELEAGRPHHSHGVEHGHLVQAMTREDSFTYLAYLPKQGQEGDTGEGDWLIEDVIFRRFNFKPI